MAYYIDDIILAFKIQYASSFVDLFERLLRGQLRRIKRRKLARYKHEFWTEEAVRTFRYAFFLRYFALFEAHLTTICDRIQARENLTLGIGDLRADSFLSTFEKYFVKVAGLPAPSNLVVWKEILVYAQVRNTIIHRDGFVKDTNPHSAIRDFAARTRTIRIGRDNRLVLRKRFAYRVLSHMARFLSMLHTAK